MGSYLQARNSGGQWLLRIEDLDPPREVPGAADSIISSLAAHGFQWDGAITYQSTRAEHYQAALHTLREHNRAFVCLCSRREIAEAGHAGKAGTVYPGTCRHAGLADAQGRALRFRVSRQKVCFEDALQGTICEDLSRTCGDFVIRRGDGLFAYQLAVVVDDAAQGVTEVVRGCDLLDSTARQLQLQEALGLPRPRYMHLPIALGTGGQKLSKQTGAPALDSQLALANLLHAYRLLRQPPPASGEVGSVGEFWSWAIQKWEPGTLAGVTEIAAQPSPGT